LMPWRKRLLVGMAVLTGVLLVTAAAVTVARGHPVGGGAGLVVLAVVIGMVLQAYWVRWDLTGRSLRWGSPRSREVALTFDDGPGPDTVAVLDALESSGVRATFFVLGQAAERHPELVRELRRRGHVVAQHGYSHRQLHLAAPATVDEELRRGREAIRAAGVEPAPFFRAPHGFKGPIVGRALRRHRLTLVGWTRGVWDTERPGVEEIVERACDRMRPGEILLLHDGCGTPGIDPRRDQTAQAIGEIVRRWQAAGFEFVTVDEMAARREQRAPAPSRPESTSATDGARPVSPTATAVPMAVPGKRPGRAGVYLRWALLASLAALAVLAVRRLDPAELRRSLSEADPAYLLAAAAANVLALLMQAGRWLAIVHPIAPRARSTDAFFSLVAGYAIGLIVPARASDLARAHLMARRSGMSMTTLAATAVVDHLLGSVALFGALGAYAAISSLPGSLRAAGTVACVASVAALALLWLLRPRDGRPLPEHGVPGLVARLRKGLVAVGRPRALAISLLFAVGGWTAEVLIALLSLRAFHLPAQVGPALLAVLATTLSSAASLSPGNAGAFELACVLALSTLGIGSEPALAFALGYHAVHLVPTAVLGGGWLIVHGYRTGVVREVP
jgi:peptidoglycan-N-acetylglucosamine deacetylase